MSQPLSASASSLLNHLLTQISRSVITWISNMEIGVQILTYIHSLGGSDLLLRQFMAHLFATFSEDCTSPPHLRCLCHGPWVGFHVMIARPSEGIGGCPSAASSAEGHSASTVCTSLSPVSPRASSCRLETIWQFVYHRGVFLPYATFFADARRRSTNF